MSRAADFEPANPDFEARVRASFARQRVMATIGARLRAVSPGRVEIELPFRDDLTQQHGFLHAGIVATLADSACGYAAFSLMSPDASVLSVEFKLNLLAPARGDGLLGQLALVDRRVPVGGEGLAGRAGLLGGTVLGGRGGLAGRLGAVVRMAVAVGRRGGIVATAKRDQGLVGTPGPGRPLLLAHNDPRSVSISCGSAAYLGRSVHV